MPEHKPKLLIVDDEPDQCESIQSYFSKRDFLVFTALSGEDALSLIKEHKPDLVLLDLRLSTQMTGKDVLSILRQTDQKTKVAMITGDLLSQEEIDSITKLGIVDLLIKPIDMQTLENVIKKVLKEDYPRAVHFEAIKPKIELTDVSLRRISHDLSNITSDIANKCELYLLDTEEGLNKDKSERERLDEAITILKSVLKSAERLAELIKNIGSLAKKEM